MNIVQFQKISAPPDKREFFSNTPHPPGNSNYHKLHTFLWIFLVLLNPHPWKFQSLLWHGGSTNIFLNCTLKLTSYFYLILNNNCWWYGGMTCAAPWTARISARNEHRISKLDNSFTFRSHLYPKEWSIAMPGISVWRQSCPSYTIKREKARITTI